jgi:hypothetical protein
MNATSMKFKDEKNMVIVESCFCLLLQVVSVFEVLVHNSMSVKSVIEKLQRITKENEAHKSEHK